MGPVRELKVSERTIGDYCVIDVSGEAYSPVELRTLSEFYLKSVSHNKNIALNLRHYDSMISSYFIGIIAGMQKTAKENGGNFVLISPSDPENLSPLELVGITRVLRIYDDETILSERIPDQ